MDAKTRINGSGLFFFNSTLTDEKKLEILNWYESLTKMEKDYVDTLRMEASDDTDFFWQQAL